MGTGQDRTAKAEAPVRPLLTAVWQAGLRVAGKPVDKALRPGSAHAVPSGSEHRRQRGALPGPSPPCRGWAGSASPAVLL